MNVFPAQMETSGLSEDEPIQKSSLSGFQLQSGVTFEQHRQQIKGCATENRQYIWQTPKHMDAVARCFSQARLTLVSQQHAESPIYPALTVVEMLIATVVETGWRLNVMCLESVENMIEMVMTSERSCTGGCLPTDNTIK